MQLIRKMWWNRTERVTRGVSTRMMYTYGFTEKLHKRKKRKNTVVCEIYMYWSNEIKTVCYTTGVVKHGKLNNRVRNGWTAISLTKINIKQDRYERYSGVWYNIRCYMQFQCGLSRSAPVISPNGMCAPVGGVEDSTGI